MLATCDYDAMKSYGQFEGAGSMIELVLSAYIYSKDRYFKFIYNDVRGIDHFIHNGVSSEEWDRSWNSFIRSYLIPSDNNVTNLANITNKDTIVISNFYKKYINDNIQSLNNNLSILRQNYEMTSTNLQTYFSKEYINVAIHIRRYTSTDCDHNPYRDLYEPNNHMNDYFLNIIKRINQKKDHEKMEINFHIYSQGDISFFPSLNQLSKNGYNILFHLDEHPIISLHHMIKADILIMSRSSFSHVAAIYSSGQKFMKEKSRNMIFDVKSISSDGRDFDI